MLLNNFLENVKITVEGRYGFRFGSLVMYLVFYFFKFLPGEEKVEWKTNILVGKLHIPKCVGKSVDTFKAYFTSLQENIGSVRMITGEILVSRDGEGSSSGQKSLEVVSGSSTKPKRRKRSDKKGNCYHFGI